MINDRIEILILKSLLSDEEFTRKVLPFIKDEYFSDETEKTVYKKIRDFVTKFSNLPSVEAISIECANDTSLPNGFDQSLVDLLSKIKEKPEKIDRHWLVLEAEKFCQEKAIYNAIMASVNILKDEKKSKLKKGAIPTLLQDALAVTFDPNVGHNYIEHYEDRYEFYHRVEEKIAFDLKYFNKITGGGTPKKSLNIIMAGTNVGKSLALCHMAGAALMQGKNVLYITLEMAEERIAERIDANLLDVPLDRLVDLPKEIYVKKVQALKTLGRLIIKEYPTATATVNHFRALLQELHLKKNFVPDIIYIDYLNIAASSRVNLANSGSYGYVKSIAEEIRGLAAEYNVPIWSATQTNRQGFNTSDVGLEDTAESFGLPQTADFIVALISTEELENLGQLLVKQLKNRYNDVNRTRSFIIGVDRPKMRLYDVDSSAQGSGGDSGPGEPEEDTPAFDRSKFGQGMKAERNKFDGFKF